MYTKNILNDGLLLVIFPELPVKSLTGFFMCRWQFSADYVR